MSITIGNTNYEGRLQSINDKFTINGSDSNQSTLIQLTATRNDNSMKEAYIEFDNYIKLGSSNNNFVITSNENVLLRLIANTIVFDQDINISKNIIIGTSTEISDTFANFKNEFHITLNNCNFLITNNNYDVVNISSNNVSIQNEIIKLKASSNITIDSILYIHSNVHVDNIEPFTPNGKVIIKNLLLTDAQITDGLFKNQITIEQHKIPDINIEENVSFGITRDKTSFNFIELGNYISSDSDLSNILTVFDFNAHLGIGLQTNLLAPLHIATTYNNKSLFIKGVGDLSIINIDNYSRIGIGTNENHGQLHIHRGDDLTEQNIRKDPLLFLNIDYNEASNNTIQNLGIHSLLEFTSNNIYAGIEHINPDANSAESADIAITFYMDFVDNDNIKYNYNSSTYIGRIGESLLSGNRPIDLTANYINGLNYSNLTTNLDASIITNGSNITLSNAIYFGEIGIASVFHNKMLPTDGIMIDNTFFNITIYSTIYSNVITNIDYIDTTPILIPAPYFTLFTSNLKELFKINEIGHVSIGYDLSNINDFNNELNVYGTTYTENLIVSNILHDINMNSFSISNLHQIYFNDDFRIAADGIYINGINALGNEVAKITTADISNISSTYLKYNDRYTMILNSFYVSRKITTYDDYNMIYPDATMIVGTHNEDGLIVINNTNTNVNSTISIISSNYSNPILKFNNNTKVSSILIDNDNTFKLKGTYDSNVYLKYQIDLNILIIGASHMITILDNDNNNPINNKILIGCPHRTYSTNSIHTTAYHIDHLTETKNLPYNINIFGDVMIRNHISDNMLSTYYHEDSGMSYISLFGDASSNILDRKYKLTVNGNISCTTGGIENADALYVTGPSTLNGTLVVIQKIYAIGGVSSLSDRNVKNELQIITNSLEKINKLTGYIYKRKDTGNMETGLIAQDVEKVLPEVINKTKDNLLSIDYGNMMGLVVEAIKSLEKRLNKLESNLLHY